MYIYILDNFKCDVLYGPSTVHMKYFTDQIDTLIINKVTFTLLNDQLCTILIITDCNKNKFLLQFCVIFFKPIVC